MNLGQRDARWGKIKLGTSNATIGSHGCTITVLAQLANHYGLKWNKQSYTPAIVNTRLLSVKGYARGNLVIWSKIKKAIPGLSFVWRGYKYENDKVSKNLPCLVEVNAKRIGASQHWVLYIGNQKMHDPWFANIKKTSYYPPTGYAIIKFTGKETMSDMYKNLDMNNKASMKVVIDLYDDVVIKKKYLSKDEADRRLSELRKVHKLEMEKLNLMTASQIEDKIAHWKKENEKLEDKIVSLSQQVLSGGQSLKSRFTSRKFLLSASGALATLLMAIAVMMGVDVDKTQLTTVLTALVSMVLLFVIPESITDHKERMELIR